MTIVRRCLRPAALLVLVAACQAGSSGRLMPVEGEGVTLTREAIDGDTAELASGTVSVRAYGFWASDAGQSLYVTYRNAGPEPIRLDIRQFKLTKDGGEAALDRVTDVTGIDIAQQPVATGDPRRLFDVDAAPAGSPPGAPAATSAALTIPAGAARDLSVGFARFQPPGSEPAVDSAITATLPAPSRPITIRFRAAGGA